MVSGQIGTDDLRRGHRQPRHVGRTQSDLSDIKIYAVSLGGTGHVSAQLGGLDVHEQPVRPPRASGEPVEVLEDFTQHHRPGGVLLVGLSRKLELDEHGRWLTTGYKVNTRTLEHRVRPLDTEPGGVDTGINERPRRGEPHRILGEQLTETTPPIGTELSGDRLPYP